MDYNKYAENETNKGTMLVSSLTGSAMAFILIGKLVESYGYTFGTIAPSVLLIFCLWWPFLQSKNYFMSQRGG